MEKMFEKGARVAFVGDSITHNGRAIAYIQEYYCTHFPEREVRIYNFGIGGDTAAGACRRLDEIMAIDPTEAVVMFGVNDMGVGYYGATPTEEHLSGRAERRRLHLEATVRLVGLLRERGLPVTLCSAVGRDEISPDAPGTKTYGATDALLAMYHDNLKAVGKASLKNTVDYLSPLQELQRGLVALGGPSLFAVDRTHPSPLGQEMMARILLRAQGLPVELPSAEAIVEGWRERPLSAKIRALHGASMKIRDLHWIYPHQRNRTEGMTLAERIEYWRAEIEKAEEGSYQHSMYKNYVENAEREPEYEAEFSALMAALYDNSVS